VGKIWRICGEIFLRVRTGMSVAAIGIPNSNYGDARACGHRSTMRHFGAQIPNARCQPQSNPITPSVRCNFRANWFRKYWGP